MTSGDQAGARAAVALAARSLGVVTLGVGSLAGCTGDDPDVDTPVPTTASGGYVCPGVPEGPMALMTGRDDLELETTSGRWGGTESMFVCHIEDAEGDLRVYVTEQDLASASTSLESLRSESTQNLRIGEEADRGGVAYQSGDQALARYVCGDRFPKVGVYRVPEGRDGAEDTARYLTSLLPWACDGAAVPD